MGVAIGRGTPAQRVDGSAQAPDRALEGFQSGSAGIARHLRRYLRLPGIDPALELAGSKRPREQAIELRDVPGSVRPSKAAEQWITRGREQRLLERLVTHRAVRRDL